MDRGDFKSWEDAVEFYKSEYKNINFEEHLDRLEMKWEDGGFEDIQAFIKAIEEELKLYKASSRIKNINLGGRPKGRTKRTIERYKKVFHQYEILNKKFSSKTKTELYELLATKDFDGKTYSRKTIRNIIEDKMYNLIPAR
tara:strand:- start:32 stop:454 length:423 start_codon:yes stop_codon:yes gene_type:complete